MIRQGVGQTSCFAFGQARMMTCATLMQRLEALGCEYRPIITSHFTRKEVGRYFDHSIFGDLKKADHIAANGLLIVNHHYPIEDNVEALQRVVAS